MLESSTNLQPFFAAALDLEGSLGDKVLFQITGFLIVMTVLASLWGAISLIGYIFKKLDLEAPPKPIDTSPKIAAREPTPGPVPPEHVAAITAALHTVLKGPHQIVDIKPTEPEK